MSKAHIDYAKNALMAHLRKATKADPSHPSPAVRESINRRMVMATQVIAMLDVAEVDPIRFAQALGMPMPMHWSVLSAEERRAWAERHVALVTPREREDGRESDGR
jgi:hypothetical protein